MSVRALLAVLAVLAIPGEARAAVTLAQGEPATGAVTLVASADARIVELVGGVELPVGDVVPYTCTTVRTFVAIAGEERSAPLTVLTPACAERLRLASVREVGLGGNLRVTLLDRWQQGDFAIDVCARPPHRRRRCQHVVMAPGQYVMHAVFRATRAGVWRVRVSDPWHREALRPIRVRTLRRGGKPVVLITGDSMMLAPQHVLERRLRRNARTVSDVYVGSGLTRPAIIDWAKLPRRQVRVYRPDATVITLGMGDSADLGGIDCCGDDFVAAYAQRARALMTTYLRGGRGAVVWLNIPLGRDPRRWPAESAVHTAVAQAAEGLARVRIVDLAALLTPNGYQESVNGVRLREDDGVHLTHVAAQLVSWPVLTTLTAEFGVVAP